MNLLLQLYKVGVVLNKMGWYPIGSYQPYSTCNGVVFTFGQGICGDTSRDGLIRSIIFSLSPAVPSSGSNPGISA